MKRLFFSLSLLPILLFCFSGCSSESKESAVLRVGTNAEFAPFAYIEDGTIKGFEIDIAQEICQRLGKEMLLKDLPFDALVPATRLGQIDFVAAGISITEERSQVVSFTLPYLAGEPLVALFDPTKVEIHSSADLASLRVVVNDGYTAEYYVTESLQLDPIRLVNPFEALLALQSGRADVFVTAQNTVAPLLKKENHQHLITLPLSEATENCAIMLPQNSSELLREINDALQAMLADGTVESLKKKWGLS